MAFITFLKSKKVEVCKECKFADLKGTDAEGFAPCCGNPPVTAFDLKTKSWYSGRPMTMLTAPACRFGRAK